MMAECWWIYNEKQITAQTRMKSYGKKNIIVLLKIKTYTHTPLWCTCNYWYMFNNNSLYW